MCPAVGKRKDKRKHETIDYIIGKNLALHRMSAISEQYE